MTPNPTPGPLVTDADNWAAGGPLVRHAEQPLSFSQPQPGALTPTLTPTPFPQPHEDIPKKFKIIFISVTITYLLHIY